MVFLKKLPPLTTLAGALDSNPRIWPTSNLIAKPQRRLSMTRESGAPQSEKGPKNDFSDLNISEPLKKGIRELGYVTPTEFQKGVFDHFHHGKNIVGEGQSNYGKSLAFSLPILSKIDLEHQGPQALIICESFAQSDLAMKECRALGRHLNISVENMASMERWQSHCPQVIMCSFEDIEKLGDIAGINAVHTVFFDGLSAKNAAKAINNLAALLTDNTQVLIFGQDTLSAFKTHAVQIIDKAVFVNNSDQPKMDIPAQHIIHQAKEDEPKPRALLAAMLLHRPKSALVSCNEATEAELLSRFLVRYGFKTVYSSEEHNRHAVAENLALVAANNIDVFICQSSLLASQSLNAIPFMVNFDMIERPQVYENTTQFNKQAAGVNRTIVNLLSSRELGYLGPIKAQCLIDFSEQSLPSYEEVVRLAAERIVSMLNQEAAAVELGQFESLAQQLSANKDALPALALLLRNHFLAVSPRPLEPMERPRERPSFDRRRPERRDMREERAPRARPSHVNVNEDHRGNGSDEPRTMPAANHNTDGSTRLYVSLGRNDGLNDLASLAQYLSDHSGVDLGHFSGTGMVRDHSAHIEVDNDVADTIIKAIHDKKRSSGTDNGSESSNTIVCERARQSTERKFHRSSQPRRGNYQRRR